MQSKYRSFNAFLLLAIIVEALALGLKEAPEPYILPDTQHFRRPPKTTTNSPTVNGAKLGRLLFYDPILSVDSTVSCSSCHKQKFAFSGGDVQFNEGINGIRGKRNTLPLFNLAWYDSFFWDGRAKSIEEQIFHPVRSPSEMGMTWSNVELRLERSKFYRDLFYEAFETENIDSSLVTQAIGQFLRTLISADSEYDRVLKGESYFDSATYAGFVLVNDQSMADCLHCHTTDSDAVGTTGKFSNNGLDNIQSPRNFSDGGVGSITGDIKEFGQFRIPSLRNVAVTAPYMHDGRFKTLDEVLDFYSSGVQVSVNIDSKMTRAHKGGVHLTELEKECVIKFLHALTDTSFLNNPNFGNPFSKNAKYTRN